MPGGRLAVSALAGLMFAVPALVQGQMKRGSRQENTSRRAGSDGTVAGTHSTWSDYGGASDSAQYSSLTQINRSTVGKLRLAWSYPTGNGTFTMTKV